MISLEYFNLIAVDRFIRDILLTGRLLNIALADCRRNPVSPEIDSDPDLSTLGWRLESTEQWSKSLNRMLSVLLEQVA